MRFTEHTRPEPPPTGDEVSTLLGFLDYQRATLAWKVDGLGSSGLNATTAKSSMSLGGLVKHMAYVENHWFSKWLYGNEIGTPWDTVDWDADPDWDWNSAADDSPDDLIGFWWSTVERSRQLVTESLNAASEGANGLDQLAARAWPSGESPSLRWIIVHMIEEYARHNGHADLLREAVDGQTGE